jgi:general secretion pathway protein B
MSYILDALRKADFERERGAIPGIHAQPVPVQTAAGARPGRAMAWLASAAAAAVAAGVAWQLGARDAARPSDPPVAVTKSVAAQPVTPEATKPAPAMTPVAATAAAAPASTAWPASDATKVAAAEPKPRPRPVGTPAVAARQATPATQAAASAAAEKPEARVHALHELPEHIRRELPTLSIGGSIYSDTPANRMLVVNGQLLHEKDKAARDVVLEQIKLKAAVLNYKGWRYEISY